MECFGLIGVSLMGFYEGNMYKVYVCFTGLFVESLYRIKEEEMSGLE